MEKNQNDVGGESSVQNMVEEIENLMDEDDSSALEVITFSRRFHKRIETQLQNDWPMVKSTLKDYGIACELNLVKYSMTFSTTRTRDPDLIDKARDLLRLFSLAVPASQAITILNGRHWDIIKLGYQKDGLCSKFGIKREQFLERRKLLFHPSLKGDILVALGPIDSVKLIRVAVEECMIHKIPPASRVKFVKDVKMQVEARKRLEALLL
ncbi:hypothetical protein M0R45_028174 [Rubus argutus]|uniref:KRR-R motif-containing protein 1 n=1 Tax=Rubus argutus TaxID=59490 RepID=A0AAW1W6Y7_RUBAR